MPPTPDLKAGSKQLPAWAEQLTRLLDDRFAIPGTNLRFGLDSVFGIIPGGGDAFGAAATLSLFMLAVQKQVPREVLVRMAMNVALDAAVGSVPVLGDVFDVAFKANRRNLSLIKEHLPEVGPTGQLVPAPRRLKDRLFIGGVIMFVILALLLPLVLLGVFIGYAFR